MKKLGLFLLPPVVLFAALAFCGELPFDIPKKLPNGEFLFFKNAISSSAFPYSDGTVIHVFTYSGLEQAENDFTAIENSSRLVTEEENAVLAKTGGRTFTAGDRNYVALIMDDTIIAVAYDGKSLTTPQALAVGAGIYTRAIEKMKERFAGPLETLKTFCEAIEQKNEPLLFECFAGTITDNIRRGIRRSLTSGYIVSLPEGPRFSIAEKIEIDNTTLNCRVAEEGPNLWNSPWFRVIRDAFSSLNLSRWSNQIDNVWVPFRKQGELWKIDVELIKVKGFAKTEEEFADWESLQACRRNFGQLSSFIHQWKRNIGGKLPEDPRELLSSRSGNWLVCPGAKNKGLELDEFGSNLLYFPYREDISSLPPDAVVFACQLGVHCAPTMQRIVLTIDGRVQTLEEMQAIKLISDAMERIKADRPQGTEKTPEVADRPLTDEEKELVQKLIEKLGADSWEIREQAQQGLVEFGSRAKPLLEEALSCDDDEVKWRIGRILKEYESEKK